MSHPLLVYAPQHLKQPAELLAKRLNADLLVDPEPQALRAYPIRLQLTEAGLMLDSTEPDIKKPLLLDFSDGEHTHRRLHGGGKGQALAKAIGIKKLSDELQVIDATAGLGGDSFVLASLGCRIHAIERSPIIHALLEDALVRAAHIPQIAPIIKNIKLHLGDAASLIPDLPKAQVIYLDPMFPHSSHTALVKKEMRLLRSTVGDDLDDDKLLNIARLHATHRVVVKRPRHAPHLNHTAPHHTLEGESSRFDIYLPIEA